MVYGNLFKYIIILTLGCAGPVAHMGVEEECV
jgi:hypothetical protein